MARRKGARNAGYAVRRAELIERMLPSFLELGPERPSLRRLASAAGVTLPTLQHYFGGRREVASEILCAWRRRREPRLAKLEQYPGPLHASLLAYARGLLAALSGSRRVDLGAVFAAGIAEGLLDEALGPVVLGQLIDPAVEALSRRLDHHRRRGELASIDTRAAALIFVSPLLLAGLHQFKLGGDGCNPVDLEALAQSHCAGFARAYGVPGGSA